MTLMLQTQYYFFSCDRNKIHNDIFTLREIERLKCQICDYASMVYSVFNLPARMDEKCALEEAALG